MDIGDSLTVAPLVLEVQPIDARRALLNIFAVKVTVSTRRHTAHALMNPIHNLLNKGVRAGIRAGGPFDEHPIVQAPD